VNQSGAPEISYQAEAPETARNRREAWDGRGCKSKVSTALTRRQLRVHFIRPRTKWANMQRWTIQTLMVERNLSLRVHA
jgi:hypothetical protein